MGDTSDSLLKLRSLTFRYQQPDENGRKPEQYGSLKKWRRSSRNSWFTK